jgi:hypothetical protein
MTRRTLDTAPPISRPYVRRAPSGPTGDNNYINDPAPQGGDSREFCYSRAERLRMDARFSNAMKRAGFEPRRR